MLVLVLVLVLVLLLMMMTTMMMTMLMLMLMHRSSLGTSAPRGGSWMRTVSSYDCVAEMSWLRDVRELDRTKLLSCAAAVVRTTHRCLRMCMPRRRVSRLAC